MKVTDIFWPINDKNGLQIVNCVHTIWFKVKFQIKCVQDFISGVNQFDSMSEKEKTSMTLETAAITYSFFTINSLFYQTKCV